MLPEKHTARLPPKNVLVRKSNRVVEASYDLTMQQLRLVHWLSRVVQEDDEDYKYYDIEVPLFLQFLQLKASNSARDRIREVTKSLQQKTILIRNPNNDEEWEQFAWLRYARVFKKNGCLTLRLSINPEMLPYIRDLHAAFTKTPFYSITQFRSRYGWRFYEWCKQFENTGWLQIEVADLRKRLQIGETEYSRFNNLRQRVIEPAIDEINRVSDLDVTLAHTIRRGRSVHALKFTIRKKDVQVIPAVAAPTEPSDKALIIGRMCSHGMPEEEAQRNFDRYYEHDRDHLVRCIDDVENKIASGYAFDKTPLAFLRYLLKNDQRPQANLFTSTVNRRLMDEERETLSRQRDARAHIQHLEDILADVHRRFRKHTNTQISAAIEQLPAAVRDAFVPEAIAGIDESMRRLVRPENVWTHKLTASKVLELLAQHGLSPDTYDNYCSNVGVAPEEINAEIADLQAIIENG